jgi:hypothetical protein
MKGFEAWLALHWGPKRWASSMHVCAKTRANELVPGAEDPIEYRVNPGEGWAETYRVLNELRLGVAEAPWQIISDSRARRTPLSPRTYAPSSSS